MIKRIILFLLLAFIGAVTYLQNDKRVHEYIGAYVKEIYQDVGNCTVDFTVQGINLFVPRIVLENVQVVPREDVHGVAPAWSYEVKTLILNYSWVSLALYGIIDLRLKVGEIQAKSSAHRGDVAVVSQHIIPMIEAPGAQVPLFLKSIDFKKAHLDIHSPEQDAMIQVDWDSESKKIDDTFKTNVHITKASLRAHQRSFAENLSGEISCNVSYGSQGLHVDLTSKCSADLIPIEQDKKKSYIAGWWRQDKGVFSIKSADQSVKFDAINFWHDGQGVHFNTEGVVPTAYALRFVAPAVEHSSVQGTCGLNIQGLITPDDFAVRGSCDMKDIAYGGTEISDASSITFEKKGDVIKGDIFFDRKMLGSEIEACDVEVKKNAGSLSAEIDLLAKGSWEFDSSTGKGISQLSNAAEIVVPGFPLWAIAPQGIKLKFELNEQNILKGLYECAVRNSLLGTFFNLQGTFHFDGDLLSSVGRFNDASYECAVLIRPTLQLKKLLYHDYSGKALIDIKPDVEHDTEFQGTMNFELLHTVIKNLFDYNVQGKGAFDLQGSFLDGDLNIKLSLADGSIIRLPETYNVIQKLETTFDLDVMKRQASAKNMQCHMQRGSFKVENAMVAFDGGWNVSHAHLPVTFESCLLNIKKDLFAIFSGTLSLHKKNGEIPDLKGNLIIERSQLKENLLSDKFQKDVFAFTGSMFQPKLNADMTCDVTIETKEPIRVDTAFFKTSAKALLHIGNTICNPQLSGSIDLLSGSLEFPYKPLNISKGHIYFMPDQVYDPAIELVATNKIKKHDVTLHVTGSLLNHHIAFESSPPLTDEQVVALLLVGSQEQSLNGAMSGLIMQNLKTVLFESEQSPLRLNNVFKSWLKPLRNINLVPSFNDQAGRGGIRGSLEVEINDRWRAMIETNFSLSEDTRLEVEYSASDDIAVRGIRNERRDVGAEVEMRWKFGS